MSGLGVVYHYTSVISLASILSNDKFFLSTSLGTKSDNDINKGKPYYMSFTRSKIGDFTISSAGMFSCVINLDYDALRTNFVIKPVEYWGKGFSNGNKNKDEFEERLLSSKSDIPALPFIKSIHVCVPTDPKTWESRDTNFKIAKSVLFILKFCKSRKIPYFLYSDTKSFVLQNKKNTISASDIIKCILPLISGNSYVRPSPSKRMNKNRPSLGYDFWMRLYYTKNIKNLPSSYIMRIPKSYDLDSSITSLEADLHNNKTSDKIAPLVRLIVKHGGVQAFVKYIADKFENMERR